MRTINNTYQETDGAFVWRGSWLPKQPWGDPDDVNNRGNYTVSSFKGSPYANVSFTFPVPGVAFYYFGLKRSGAQYGICVDCNPDRDHSDIRIINPPNATGTDQSDSPVLLYHQRWNTTIKHTITLWNLPGNLVAVNESQITVDRFVVEVRAKGESDVGTIIGGVVGSVAFVAIIGLLAWFWRRTRRFQRRDEQEKRANFIEPHVLCEYAAERVPEVTAFMGVPHSSRTNKAATRSQNRSVPENVVRREVDAGPVEDLQPPDYDTIPGSSRQGDSTADDGTTETGSRRVSPGTTGKRRPRENL